MRQLIFILLALAQFLAAQATANARATEGSYTICDECTLSPVQILALHLTPVLELLEKGAKVTNMKGKVAIAAGVTEKTKELSLSDSDLDTNIRKTCAGHDLVSIRKIIQKKSGGDQVLAKTLEAIMITESQGHCSARRAEANGSVSSGLFQINSASSALSECRKYHSTKNPVFREAYRNQCVTALRNPDINTREAVRILRDKERELFDGAKPVFDRNEMTREDQLRIVLSAYNGGERWPIVAKKALIAFNLKHNTDLNPNRWEDLRLFYMRGFLSSEVQSSLLANGGPSRSKYETIVNLAYVESLLPVKVRVAHRSLAEACQGKSNPNRIM